MILVRARLSALLRTERVAVERHEPEGVIHLGIGEGDHRHSSQESTTATSDDSTIPALSAAGHATQNAATSDAARYAELAT
jgi:hypothetical protein